MEAAESLLTLLSFPLLLAIVKVESGVPVARVGSYHQLPDFKIGRTPMVNPDRA